MKQQYTGTKLKKKVENWGPDQKTLMPYIPDQGLVRAVNLALHLKRPLLIMGEPGCGKTRLSEAVAHELGWEFEEWRIKSTHQAKDGLYRYDLVGKLRDAQLEAHEQLDERVKSNIAKEGKEYYVDYRAIGRAIKGEQNTVLLIDEIDKADRDFPNDLLMELDEERFKVEETDQTWASKKDLLVLITSNDERDLPEAFLRRCLFYYINFPAKETLTTILSAIFPTDDREGLEKAIDRFVDLRNQMVRDFERGDPVKKISTSELIDWIKILRTHPKDEMLSMLQGELPYEEVLIKKWADHKRYIQRSGK